MADRYSDVDAELLRWLSKYPLGTTQMRRALINSGFRCWSVTFLRGRLLRLKDLGFVDVDNADYSGRVNKWRITSAGRAIVTASKNHAEADHG
ncbi:MAG: hypothetical protein P4L82_12120 [Ancalomicrobiaceae bacterium]|nr:hypothetical protein [Ancalomicrobiaceae bacterium]